MGRTTKNTSWVWIICKLLQKVSIEIFKFLIYLLKLTFGLIILVVRYSAYYLFIAIYRLLKLQEIDDKRIRKELLGKPQKSFNKHEVAFDKSEQFMRAWGRLERYLREVDLDKEDKKELMEYIKMIITESERDAFKVAFDYLKNKKNLIPSYDNMLVEKTIEEKRKGLNELDDINLYKDPLWKRMAIKRNLKKDMEDGDDKTFKTYFFS